MGLVLELDPPLSGELRTQVIALWTDVTNAGGAVGFVAPVTVEARPVFVGGRALRT